MKTLTWDEACEYLREVNRNGDENDPRALIAVVFMPVCWR